MIDRNGAGVLIPIPLPKDRIFRNQAMDDILEFLYRNPHDEFSVRELRDITGHGGQTVNDALEYFLELGLIKTRREGNKKLISINRKMIQKPKDPVMRIPQEEFRAPIRGFIKEIENLGDEILGVMIFGSVARGEGDRTSDIDIFIVVEEDLLQFRRKIQEIRQAVEEQRFEGSRYEYQVMVESLKTAREYEGKLKTIFSEGIPVKDTDEFQELRGGVLRG